MRRAILAIVVLFSLTGGYSILWFVGSTQIISSIQSWKLTESSLGRFWNCEKEGIGGFPLRIVFTCSKPTLEFFGTKRVYLAADFLRVYAHIASPTQVNFSISAQLSIGLPQQVAKVSFDQLSGFVAWRGVSARELKIMGKDLLISAEPGSLVEDWHGSRLESIALGLSNLGALNPILRQLDIVVDIRGARATAQNALTISGTPLDVKVLAQLAHSGLTEGDAIAQLERWRTDGGSLNLKALDMSSNNSKIGFSGSFQLDDLRRPTGKGDVRFSDAQILTNALKTSASGNFTFAIGSSKPSNGRPGAGRPFQAPISLANGKVYVGPIDTRLRTHPLY